ncbi:UNVERIFIED_ORG: hypothetical protein ABIC48_005390 [Burkholderia territorii]
MRPIPRTLAVSQPRLRARRSPAFADDGGKITIMVGGIDVELLSLPVGADTSFSGIRTRS